MDFTSIIIIVTSILLALIFYVRKKYSYWAERGVAFIEPKFPFGNVAVFNKTEHNSQQFTRFYNEKKGSGPLCGIYFFLSPVAVAIDIEFIRNVFIRDFQHFQDRGMFYNEKDDPLSAHLFNLESNKWRLLRPKLTPTFTSGKMRFMFPTMVEVANQFQICLNDMIEGESELEIRDLLGRFTTDIIGTCAFGIQCNSLKDPNTKFRVMGKKTFELRKNSIFERLLMTSFPNLAKRLHLIVHHKDVTAFFLNIVTETIAYREKNNVHRNDFMDLLIELKNKGHPNDDPKNKLDRLTIHEIAAQAYVFFLAGFETSSTTLTFCLYELALNKDIQNKAREEIDNVLKKHDGGLSYEALNEMVYVERIINETLRKYPPGANIIRKTTKDYSVPGTNYTLAKDTLVLIPVYAVHHDPEFYTDPEKFMPERFEADQVKQRPSCSFIPFGDGPRNCIGLRFGMLQARIGLVTLLKSFEFSPSERTPIPLVFSPKLLVLSPIDGLCLNVKIIK